MVPTSLHAVGTVMQCNVITEFMTPQTFPEAYMILDTVFEVMIYCSALFWDITSCAVCVLVCTNEAEILNWQLFTLHLFREKQWYHWNGHLNSTNGQLNIHQRAGYYQTPTWLVSSGHGKTGKVLICSQWKGRSVLCIDTQLKFLI